MPAARIGGLDVWRSGLMIGGLFFHALPGDDGGLLFVVVDYLSSHFRMGAFFAISGFLTGIAAASRDEDDWLRRRLGRLLPPLASGALITVVAMALLAPRRIATLADATALLFNWYHIWFLAALIAYLPLGARLGFGASGPRLHAWIVRTAAQVGSVQRTVMIGLCTACFALLVTGAAVIEAVPGADSTVLKYLPLALCYAPIYAAGILFGRFEDLRRDSLGRAGPPALCIAGLILGEWAFAQLGARAWPAPAMVADAISRATLPALGALLVLRSAIALRRVPAIVRPLCDASMTIYILHVPAIRLIERALGAVAVHPYLRYLLVVALAGGLSWAFHAWAVERSATLRWLLNGGARPLRRASRVRA